MFAKHFHLQENILISSREDHSKSSSRHFDLFVSVVFAGGAELFMLC